MRQGQRNRFGLANKHASCVQRAYLCYKARTGWAYIRPRLRAILKVSRVHASHRTVAAQLCRAASADAVLAGLACSWM